MAQHPSGPEVTVNFIKKYAELTRKAYGYDSGALAYSTDTILYLLEEIAERDKEIEEYRSELERLAREMCNYDDRYED